MRILQAAGPWLLTLVAGYITLRRSGVYGLVTDAQNLIAIFGVLRAAASACRRGNFSAYPHLATGNEEGGQDAATTADDAA